MLCGFLPRIIQMYFSPHSPAEPNPLTSCQQCEHNYARLLAPLAPVQSSASCGEPKWSRWGASTGSLCSLGSLWVRPFWFCGQSCLITMAILMAQSTGGELESPRATAIPNPQEIKKGMHLAVGPRTGSFVSQLAQGLVLLYLVYSVVSNPPRIGCVYPIRSGPEPHSARLAD